MNDFFNNDMDTNVDDGLDNEAIISKSAKKREMVDMLTTVEALISLPAGKLTALDLEENLHLSITQAKSMRKNGARKRQVAFIRNRLIKMSEDDLSAINNVLHQTETRGQQQMASIATAEHWATRLLDTEEQKLSFEQWISQYTQSDIQQLHSLQRNALKEQAKNNEAEKKPARKKLVLWLKRYIDESINE